MNGVPTVNGPRARADGATADSRKGLGPLLGEVYWVLLLVVLPLLLPPWLLWTTSITAPISIQLFRAIAAWGVLWFGLVAVLVLRRDVGIVQVIRSLPRLRLPFKLLYGFLSLVVLSTFFSNFAPVAAALGSSGRADGTLMQVAWFGLALVSSELAQTDAFRLTRIPRYLALSGTATSLWIFLHVWNVDPLTILSRSHFHLAYAAGAFGHGGIASIFLAFCLVVVSAMWSVQGHVTWWRLGTIFLIAAGMVASGGRAGIVGFLVAGALLLLGAFRGQMRRSTLLSFAVLSLVGGAVGLVMSPHSQAQARSSAAGVFEGDWGGSVKHRVIAWKLAMKVIEAHVLFGVGPEGFMDTWWRQASPSEQAALLSEKLGFVPRPGTFRLSGDVVVVAEPSTHKLAGFVINWDKAHDYYLDIALASGLPSLLLYLAFLGVALMILLRSPSPLAFGIGAGLVAFAVWGLAWFYNVSLDPTVWGLVGAGLGWHWRSDRTAPS